MIDSCPDHEQQACRLPPFAAFLNCYYSCGLMPFSLRLDTVRSSCFIKDGSKLTKVACIVFYCGVFFVSIQWLNYAIAQYQIRSEDISPFFNFISTTCCIISNVYMFKIIWLDRSKLELISGHAMKLAKFSKLGNIKAVLLGLSQLGIQLFLRVSGGWKEMVADWTNSMNAVRDIFCGSSEATGSTNATNYTSLGENNLLEDNSPGFIGRLLSVILPCLFAFGVANSTHFFFMSQGLLITFGLTLTEVGNSFRKQLQIFTSAEDGVSYYRDLRHLQNSINFLSSHIIMLYYITVLLYYAESPFMLAQRHILSWNWLTGQIYHLIIHTLFWIIAANYNRMVKVTAMEWIYALEAIQELPQEDRIILVSFAVQVDRDSVGFSSNYFTITYGLLGSMIAIVFTYAFIVFQVNQVKL